MAKLNFTEQMKKNTSKAKTELKELPDTPAIDVFSGADIYTPNPTDKSELELPDESEPKRSRKHHPADDKSMPGRPMADNDHVYRQYHGAGEGSLYVYQIRVTEQNKFWLYTYSAREDKPVYQIVRQIFDIMIPEFANEQYTLTMQDYQPLYGGKQLTVYLTREEIDRIKNGARQKGLKLIHYVDKLLNRYREEYDPAFAEMTNSPKQD